MKRVDIEKKEFFKKLDCDLKELLRGGFSVLSKTKYELYRDKYAVIDILVENNRDYISRNIKRLRYIKLSEDDCVLYAHNYLDRIYQSELRSYYQEEKIENDALLEELDRILYDYMLEILRNNKSGLMVAYNELSRVEKKDEFYYQLHVKPRYSDFIRIYNSILSKVWAVYKSEFDSRKKLHNEVIQMLETELTNIFYKTFKENSEIYVQLKDGLEKSENMEELYNTYVNDSNRDEILTIDFSSFIKVYLKALQTASKPFKYIEREQKQKQITQAKKMAKDIGIAVAFHKIVKMIR